MTQTPTETAEVPPSSGVRDRARLWWRESSGAVGDLGVLIPIAVALIVVNGLTATAVLLPAALAYLLVAAVYRLPVAVQPLKAFGAVAIAAGAGADVIAAGSIIMGATFVVLGLGNWIDRVAAWFPVAVIRGVQLSVGLLFVKVAWGLATTAQPTFGNQPEQWVVIGSAAVLFALLLALKGKVVLVVVVAAIAVAWFVGGGVMDLGPTPLVWPSWTLDSFVTAAVLLVLPQLPLTFANSCLAPADAARSYFGTAGERVTPGRLARTLGSADIFAGAISGMPVCHGAGGMTAHHAFGARTWRAPVVIGSALLIVAIGFGAALERLMPAFPLAVLAALLAVAGITHVKLLRDLSGTTAWVIAIGVGVVGFAWNLAAAVVIGLIAALLMKRRGNSGAHNGSVDDRTPTDRPAKVVP